MDDELKRHIAELEGKVRELEARWAEVPWATLIAAIWFVRKHANGSVDLLRKLDEADACFDANAPKEPTP